MERTTTITTGQATAKKAMWPLLLMLVLMLATLLAATPAMAQVEQETDQESESGVEIDAGVANEGDYASQCAPALQFGNAGNFNNAPASLQYGSEADDFEPGGIEFTAEPGLAAECNWKIQQAAAANSAPKAKENRVKEKKAEEKKASPVPKIEAKAAEAKAEAPKAEAKTGGVEAKTAPKAEQIKAAPKELPKTGGAILPIVGVGGALLIGGGLLIRKLAR